MALNLIQPSLTALYEEDFAVWCEHNAALIREGRLNGVDLENVAEEIEAMARCERNELTSRVRVILMHLLKWQYQSRRRSSSWRNTLLEQRFQANDRLDASPSLRRGISDQLPRVYRQAVRAAATETRLRPSTFPAQCPYTVEQILDLDFLPVTRPAGAGERRG